MQASSTPNPLPNDARHQSILDDLITMAHDLARAIHRRAMADATAAPEAATAALPPAPAQAPDHTPDFTIAFDRIARTVRRTVALSRHIAAEEARGGPAAPLPRVPAPQRAAARAQLIRGVEDAIHRKRRDLDTEPLYAELNERLDDPELDGDLQNRLINDIIEDICRDLGVAQQGRSWVWRRRTPQDIATLRQRAASPPLTLMQGSKPPTPSPGVGRTSEAPCTTRTAPTKAPTLVPIPEDPPPDLADMLALCAHLAGDG